MTKKELDAYIYLRIFSGVSLGICFGFFLREVMKAADMFSILSIFFILSALLELVGGRIYGKKYNEVLKSLD